MPEEIAANELGASNVPDWDAPYGRPVLS